MKKGLILLITMILIGCGSEQINEEVKEVKPVETIELVEREIKKEVVGNSDILPLNKATQITKSGGEVVEINYKNGDWVERGDVILKIYNEEVISRYERAKADALNKKAQMERRKKFAEMEKKTQLKEAEAAYIDAKETLVAAEKRWNETQINYERNKQIYDEELISEIEFLSLESSYQEARGKYISLKSGGIAEKKNKYELARYKVEQKEWEYDIREAVSASQLADAEYNAAKKDYEDLQVKARIGGYVADMDLDLYEELDENIFLFTLLDTEKVRVETTVAGSDIAYINVGDEVEVYVEDLGKGYTGEVYEINPQGDESTRRFPIKVSIDNVDGKLKSGMYAKVIMKSAKKKGLVVPKEAVMIRELVEYVAVIREEAAVIISVKTGISTSDQVEIISEELESGDKIVVRGQYLLEAGDSVREVQ